jgi:Protein of unknown function (DUF4232)
LAGRCARAGLALAAVALTAAGCGFSGGTKTVTVNRTQTVTTTQTVTSKFSTATEACTGADLAGTFALVPGSAGAGQIEYALTVTNTSHTRCFVRGVPKATLLGASGAALPTHVTSAGDGGSGRIMLEPGASAVAHARFSPDVSGQGDSQSGACQPEAQTLQVNPDGGGATDATIKPPTSVCERGTLNFEAFGYAG